MRVLVAARSRAALHLIECAVEDALGCVPVMIGCVRIEHALRLLSVSLDLIILEQAVLTAAGVDIAAQLRASGTQIPLYELGWTPTPNAAPLSLVHFISYEDGFARLRDRLRIDFAVPNKDALTKVQLPVR